MLAIFQYGDHASRTCRFCKLSATFSVSHYFSASLHLKSFPKLFSTCTSRQTQSHPQVTMGDSRRTEQASPNPMEIQRASLSSSTPNDVHGVPVDSFFDSPSFSDVTIHFSGGAIKAHKLALAQGAPYFRSMLLGDIKVRVRSEAAAWRTDLLTRSRKNMLASFTSTVMIPVQ